MIFKCKMCGGDLEVLEGTSVCSCMYCGTKQTLPKNLTDARASMYERASYFRRSGDYDKAAEIYERILEADGTDSEAYWSLVLCKYGVTYVEEKSSGKRVITCNRTQAGSVFADGDYKKALECADSIQRVVLEKEAVKIDEIQKGILAVSEKEKPFDIFICCKEKDKSGKRTMDSVLAEEMYGELTKARFRVFLAQITLKDKAGTAYEPYIYAALNSAKVMVVVGTRAEHVNSVWVKNEWNRYLALIREGKEKVLIPVYRDMEPQEFPEELAYLQAMDMDKLGFMQDLTERIRKVVSGPASGVKTETVKNQAVTEKRIRYVHTTAKTMLERAFICLQYSEWAKADSLLEQVLNSEPRNAEAYIGKMMVDLKINLKKNLPNSTRPLTNSLNFAKANQFADKNTRSLLKHYNDAILKRKAEEEKQKKYQEACAAMEKDDFYSVDMARRYFETLGEYKDSQERMEQCRESICSIEERLRKEKEEGKAKGKAMEERKRRENEITGFVILLIIITVSILYYMFEM